MATAFAQSTELDRATLHGRAAALAAARRRSTALLKVTPQKSADAAAQLGLLTVGDLLEHLPRDRREARTVADAGARRHRDGRRRGALDHEPARCAGAG